MHELGRRARAVAHVEPDLAGQRKVAEAIQKAAYDFVPYIPTGQFVTPTVFRKTLSGIITAPVVFLWNVEKS